MASPRLALTAWGPDDIAVGLPSGAVRSGLTEAEARALVEAEGVNWPSAWAMRWLLTGEGVNDEP